MSTSIVNFPETGIYLRVKRNEKFQNVLIEDLTKEELKELIIDNKDNLEDWVFPVFELLQHLKFKILNE
jgi:hypothetical protein